MTAGGTTNIKYHETPDRVRYRTLAGPDVRDAFLLKGLFVPGQVNLVYWDQDRTVVGGAAPTGGSIKLGAPAEMRCEYFLERRELGVLNIGGAGSVTVDGKKYDLANKDGLYISRGAKEVLFSGADSRYYLLSYPAHKEYPTTLITRDMANKVPLGAPETANKRTIYQMIHPGGVLSCQLVMGYTELEPGSVWNTFPPHTHQRRTEVYLYFDMDPNTVVLHLLGEPEATQHLIMRDREVALSPPWSVHCGAGSAKYTFCWGMGGENQRFDDMDHVKLPELV